MGGGGQNDTKRERAKGLMCIPERKHTVQEAFFSGKDYYALSTFYALNASVFTHVPKTVLNYIPSGKKY